MYMQEQRWMGRRAHIHTDTFLHTDYVFPLSSHTHTHTHTHIHPLQATAKETHAYTPQDANDRAQKSQQGPTQRAHVCLCLLSLTHKNGALPVRQTHVK